ncbi:MAG: gliding motility-associated C-terminal domain-containing protein [Saprospiraceae bacterium]|nr:gliding motility-associated C-terminal domain-containing protein [Saprospiraceae bacterium]
MPQGDSAMRIILPLVIALFTFHTANASMNAVMCDDTLDIDIVGSDVSKGDSVCVDLIFSGFDSVNSLQFSITWDPSVLQFSSLQDVNPGGQIDDLFPVSFGRFSADDGVIRFLWFDNNVDGESAPDNFVVARLCFQAVGAPGDETEISISDFPLRYEAEDPDGNKFCLLEDGQETIRITLPSDLCVISTSCATRTNTGSITVTPFGGQPPYLVDIPTIGVAGDMISNQGDFLTYNMLNPGSYTVIVTDNTGRDTTMTVEVVNAEALTIDTTDLRFPTCADAENGIIEIEANGGSEPYRYTWSPISASGQTRLIRIPGDVYTVTVKDSLGCTSRATFDLTQDFLTADTNLIQLPSCSGRNDGILEVTAQGGTPFPNGTYDFRWSVNPAANNRGRSSTNSMVGGSGYVVVEDAVGCTDTVFFDLPAVSNLNIRVLIDSVQCHGDSSARVVIIANPGMQTNPPYQFLLFRESGPVVTGGSVLLNEYRHDSLWAGEFRLRLEDANGCSLRDTFNIEEPPPLDVIIVDADTSAGCSPGNDAYLEVNGFMGNGGPYTFSWDYQNAITPRIDQLTAGQYSVTVTDKKGCTAERSFQIEGGSSPMITGFDVKDVGCVGDTTGEITVLYLLGDTTINNITWNNGQSGPTITGLRDGDYIVTITDNNGCTAIDTATVNVPPTSIQISSFIIDTPSCNGSTDGFLQIMVSGGTGNYSYQWSNNTNDSILTDIGAGRYIVAVRDDSNCPPVIDTFDIPEPPAVEIDILEINSVSCNNDTTCNGVVIAQASGGPDPSLGYNFIWSSGELGTSLPDTASQLCMGQQLLIVANGDCVDSQFIDVPAPEKLSVDFNSSDITRPSCAGEDDGAITIVPVGGVGTKRVRWDFGPTTNTLTDLPAGTYQFLIEDDNGCLHRDSVEIRDPDPLDAFVLDAASRDISCNGEQDGRIVIAWRGGNSGPAEFEWTPSVSSDSIGMNLGSGMYGILVTDSRGCTDSVEVTLIEPSPIQADFPMSDTVPCFGEQLPVSVIAASGGNGPAYTYSINNGPRRQLGQEVALFGGTYTISVFDSEGCRIDSSFTIYQPMEINVDIGPEVTEINLGDSIRLCYQTNIPGANISTVNWTPQGRPLDSTLTCIWLKPFNDITVNLTITDLDGCIAEDEMTILVDKNRKVFVPNVFNPRGNVNTEWKIFTGQGVKAVRNVKIYDRWGELVYSVDDPSDGDGWDGTYQGTNDPMPNGVYVYVVTVEYLDDELEIRRGDITLIR